MDRAKSELRERLLAARRARPPAARDEAGAAITHAVLALPEITDSSSVAAYLSIGTEPPTMHLVESLRSRGVRVVVPVVGDDLDLDWADYGGPDALAQSQRGLREPTGPRLGVAAVAAADVVLVPGVAVTSAAPAWAGAAVPTTEPCSGCLPGGRWLSCCTTRSCCPSYRPNRTTSRSRWPSRRTGL